MAAPQLKLEDFVDIGVTDREQWVNIVDIHTPKMYSACIRASKKTYLVVIQELGTTERLLRQILELNNKKRTIADRTFDKDTIEEIKGKLAGLTYATEYMSWYDFVPEEMIACSRNSKDISK
ncbi:MAG: hypothetical protein AB7U31_07965 [Synergistaceae bacterium]